jgi:hypothetical protein
MDFLGRLKTICGGETGIRTLDTLRYTRFPSVRLQPLGHLSAVLRVFLNLPQSEPLEATSRDLKLQGACASTFCLATADDFNSTGTP